MLTTHLIHIIIQKHNFIYKWKLQKEIKLITFIILMSLSVYTFCTHLNYTTNRC
jgi:hypothetical protein